MKKSFKVIPWSQHNMATRGFSNDISAQEAPSFFEFL